MPRRSSTRSKSSSAPAIYAKSRVPQEWKHGTGALGACVVDGILESVIRSVVDRAVHAAAEAITEAFISPRVAKQETIASNIVTSDSCGEKIVASSTLTYDPCIAKNKAYEDCRLGTYGSDINDCEFYMNMLTECRKAASFSFSTS